MKTYKILISILLLSSISAFSQYGNYYGNRNYGLNRDLNQGYTGKPSGPTAEDIEKNRIEQIDRYMSLLKDELKLDDLQFIAIKNEVMANSKNVNIVMKKENSDEDKGKEIKALMEQTEARINTYLSSEQKEKFKNFNATLKDKLKEKKDKKGKHRKEEKPIEEKTTQE